MNRLEMHLARALTQNKLVNDALARFENLHKTRKVRHGYPVAVITTDRHIPSANTHCSESRLSRGGEVSLGMCFLQFKRDSPFPQPQDLT
jgi:hypothetical protein